MSLSKQVKQTMSNKKLEQKIYEFLVGMPRDKNNHVVVTDRYLKNKINSTTYTKRQRIAELFRKLKRDGKIKIIKQEQIVFHDDFSYTTYPMILEIKHNGQETKTHNME